MEIKIYILNAFAKTKYGGNPAGVVLNADLLTESQMKKIAQKVGFSETAFIQKSDNADFKVRFFTPIAEVDLCGHATIATFYLLAQKEIIKKGIYTQETKAGILEIENRSDDIIFMSQSKPEFYEKIERDEIANSLNIKSDFIMNHLPIQIVSTGLRDIFIPICSLDKLLNIKPDFYKVAEISRKYDVVGYHLFTMETKNKATAHCRNLAPLYDIPEEAATGTSSGALSCYLFNYGLITKDKTTNLIFEQGYIMDKPSEILASLKIEENFISRVNVGGIAQGIKEMIIEI